MLDENHPQITQITQMTQMTRIRAGDEEDQKVTECILFITRNYPPKVGGLEEYSYNLASFI